MPRLKRNYRPLASYIILIFLLVSLGLIILAWTQKTSLFTRAAVRKPSQIGCKWNLVNTPVDATLYHELNDVKALAPDNVWAVGRIVEGATSSNLIIHWDGNIWTRVPAPNLSTFHNELRAIDGVTANDLWVAGSYTPPGGQSIAFVLHWNGFNWRTSEIMEFLNIPPWLILEC